MASCSAGPPLGIRGYSKKQRAKKQRCMIRVFSVAKRNGLIRKLDYPIGTRLVIEIVESECTCTVFSVAKR